MSEKNHTDKDLSATMIVPSQDDSGATLIVPPSENATIILAPSDGSTQVVPAVKSTSAKPTNKTGEMQAIPASQASAFDILLGKSGVVINRQFELKKSKLTIGRSPFNDIIIKTDSVSASHAEIERVKGCWILRDVGSINGIYVNGEHGSEGDEFDLVVSDQILIGDVVLQLCSPHTIKESLETPIHSNSKDSKAIYIAVGVILIVAISLGLLLV